MNLESALWSRFTASTLDGLASHAAYTLIFSLWVGMLLVLAISICLHFARPVPARLRFFIWMVAFVALPVVSLLNQFFIDHSAKASSIISVPHLKLDARWSYLLAALWCAAVIIRFTHLALQAVRLRSLWSAALPVSAELLPERSLGGVELCISTEIDRPSVIGFFAPRILIPAWLFGLLTPGELHQIVLHELEHLRRRDDWINLLQKIGLVVFPLTPALFWIDRRLATERELACDDGVLSRTLAPRAYAACLTNIAERRLEHRRQDNRVHGPSTALALGAIGAVRHSGFSRRIESILSRPTCLRPAPARALAVLLVAGVLGGAFTLARAPQLVSFTVESQTQPFAALETTAQVPGTDRTFRFENTVFHPEPAATNRPVMAAEKKMESKSHRMTPTRQTNAVFPEVVKPENIRSGARLPETARRTSGQWIVLASWQRPPQRALVTLPDGRTLLVTYAAEPEATMDQAGWLLIQL